MKKTDVLIYTGGATKRSISKSEWESVDITQDDTVWNKLNRHRCLVGDISPEALEYLLTVHADEFRVAEAAEIKAEDTKPANTAAVTPAPNGN